jgi:hypothetical protein
MIEDKPQATIENTPAKYRYTYVPNCCQAHDVPEEIDAEGNVRKTAHRVEPEYEGTITLSIPTYEERLELSDYGSMNLEKGDDREAIRIKAEKAVKDVGYARRLASRVDRFVIAVNIRRKSDGYVLDCLEDLRRDGDMIMTVTEIGAKLCSKLNVGNSQTTT